MAESQSRLVSLAASEKDENKLRTIKLKGKTPFGEPEQNLVNSANNINIIKKIYGTVLI